MNRGGLSQALLCAALVCVFAGCGGGGGGGGNPSTPPVTVTPAPPLSLTGATILPGAISGKPYSFTFAVTGGTAPLKWSVAAVSGTVFADGLTMNADTGTISGTANWSGQAQMNVMVTDSRAQSTSSIFLISASPALQPGADTTTNLRQYDESYYLPISWTNGTGTISFRLSSGALPPGVKIVDTRISGAPLVTGNFQWTVAISDSFSPPETVTQSFNVTVLPPNLRAVSPGSLRLPLGRPAEFRISAVGGVPPYVFTLNAPVPPGMTFDASTGRISGVPAVAGDYTMGFNLEDSASPPNTTFGYAQASVRNAGRNDSIATSTPIGNGTLTATISPFGDPSSSASEPADNDYYQLKAAGGALVHVETNAKRNNPRNPLDTVIELLDGNGARLSSCRPSGDATATYTSECLNDDLSASPHVQDSAIDFQVPGAAGSQSSFYIHVFDWRGDARPDMRYTLNVSGVLDPLHISTTSLLPALLNSPYTSLMKTTDANGSVAWSLAAGALPPGLTLSSAGSISGTPTVSGSYSFVVHAADSAPTPKVADVELTLEVGNFPHLPDTDTILLTGACYGQPYTFTVPVTGGTPPLRWAFFPLSWYSSIHFDPATATFSGIAQSGGTGAVYVGDSTNHWDMRPIRLDVASCP